MSREGFHRSTTGLTFWCPGCGDMHHVDATKGWTWNGSVERPTVTPSLKISSGHYASQHVPGSACWCGTTYGFSCYVCHFTITDGGIQFHSDCTHGMAGQLVRLAPVTP